jgi:ATP-dependent Clp protease ATP-binding subunit ClpA
VTVHSDNRSGEPTCGDGGHDDADPQLSAELRAVISSARRRAARDGDRQMDTAHLLHSLLESDSHACEALDDGSGKVVRLMAYLAQRSIGYGMRWHGTVEDSGAVRVLAEGGSPGWSPSTTAALLNAAERASVRGSATADGTDLLSALVADPECRAVEVLRAVGVDPRHLVASPRGAG